MVSSDQIGGFALAQQVQNFGRLVVDHCVLLKSRQTEICLVATKIPWESLSHLIVGFVLKFRFVLHPLRLF